MAAKLTSNTGADFGASFPTTPASGDTLYVKGTGATYTANVSLPAVDLNGMYWQPTFTGDMGDESHHLDITVNNAGAAKFVAAWGGRFGHVSGGTAGVIANVEMRPTKNGHLVLSACDVATIVQVSGVLDLTATCDAETVRVSGGKCTAEYSAETGTLAEASDKGVIEVHRVFATVRAQGGGRVIFGRDDCPPSSALEILPGGYAKYLGGTVPSLTLKPGGTLDLSDATQPITFTAAELHEGSTIVYPTSGVALTWSSATIVGRDPRNPQ